MATEKRLPNPKGQRPVHACACPTCRQHPKGPLAREHRVLNRLLAASDERMRRLLVGFLARQHGRGGVALLARITGLDRHLSKKKSRGSECLGGVARRHGGWRPHLRDEVDASVAPQTPEGPSPTPDSARPEYDCPAAEQ